MLHRGGTWVVLGKNHLSEEADSCEYQQPKQTNQTKAITQVPADIAGENVSPMIIMVALTNCL